MWSNKKDKPLTSSNGTQYYWYYCPPGRNNPGSCSLSIDAGTPYEFRLEREGRGHRIAEWLGFTGKFETGDPVFDAKVYIDCDDQMLCESLRNVTALRRVIMRLFDNGIKIIAIEAGRLKVVPMIVRSWLGEEELELLLADLVELKRLLPVIAMMTQSPVNSTRINAKIFCYIIIALLPLGAVATIFDMLQRWQLIAPLSFFTLALEYALAVIALSLLIIKMVFHRSSYGYDVLKTFLALGILGLLLCVSAVMYNINMRCDNSPAQIISEPVTGKYTTSSKHGLNYHLRITDWHDAQKTFSVNTESVTYNRVTPGTTSLYMRIHPGYLGFEWMEGYQVVSQ